MKYIINVFTVTLTFIVILITSFWYINLNNEYTVLDESKNELTKKEIVLLQNENVIKKNYAYDNPSIYKESECTYILKKTNIPFVYIKDTISYEETYQAYKY